MLVNPIHFQKCFVNISADQSICVHLFANIPKREQLTLADMGENKVTSGPTPIILIEHINFFFSKPNVHVGSVLSAANRLDRNIFFLGGKYFPSIFLLEEVKDLQMRLSIHM